MNISIYRTLILLLSTILFVGCEKVIEFKETDIEPMLVVNCVITPDSLVKIDLSRSLSALEEKSYFSSITNATITISDGSTTFSDFEYKGKIDSSFSIYGNSIDTFIVDNRYYLSNGFKIEKGKNYSLTISADGFDDLVAETEIPYFVEIDRIDTFETSTQDQSMTMNNYNTGISFTDPGMENNFYRLKLEMASVTVTTNPETGQTTIYPSYNEQYINSDDPVFGQNTSGGLFGGGNGNTYSVFSDQLFNGKTYRIEFIYKTDYSYEGSEDYSKDYFTYEIFKIELVSLSESYFNYLKTTSLQSNAGNDPFSDPVLVYTNVENGTGIFGAYSASSRYLITNAIPEEYTYILPTTEPSVLFEIIKQEYKDKSYIPY